MALHTDLGARRETVVALQGEIDASNADSIVNAATLARRWGYPTLVLDLSEVTFMDSQGIKAIVVAQRALAADGGDLVLRRPSAAVRRVVEITGLTQVVAVRG